MKKQGTLLIVDDNRSILTTVKMLLEDTFSRIIALNNPNGIPAALREEHPDVVLLDMNFNSGINSGNEGLFWLHEIKQSAPKTQVVLFTAYADIELAVKGMKEGAFDFIVKPWNNAKMIDTLTHAFQKHTGGRGATVRESSAVSAMYWGDSAAMRQLRQTVEKVAATDANLLITGENGTGKEMLANEIHRLSMRHGGPMVPIDMGAVTETLFESELFGHVKGAFTDARDDKPGKFELANGGTLFLDEIGNLSFALQAKLLSAIQRREIVRIGGTKPIPINVRLLCATNRDLPAMVDQGGFREDLLYRINTIHLQLPALRERREDIVPLAELFLKRYEQRYQKAARMLTDSARRKLTEQLWPGNIRELEHVIEKTVILCEGPEITAEDIDCPNGKAVQSVSEAVTLEEVESRVIRRTIDECEGNLSVVANRLGISRQTLYNKIKRYGL